MKRTPFYHTELAIGASMSSAGFIQPTKFTNSLDEHNAMREHVGICDFSGMGEIDVKGTGARQFLDEHCVNKVSTLKPGRIVYTTILNENAEIIEDATIFCHSDTHFWVVTTAPQRIPIFDWLTKESEGKDVWVTDISAGTALLSVQGPESRKMLTDIVPAVADMKFFGFAQTTVAGIPALVSRTGYTGELGYEIYMDVDVAHDIWDALAEAGKPFNVKYCGTNATVVTLAVEKGFLSLREYGDKRNPLEVGLDWTIQWDKPFFVGKAKLEELRKNGTAEMLMGFIVDDEKAVIPMTADVFVDGQQVGKVTSACYGPTVKKNIGICHIASEFARIGQRIQLKTNDGMKDATIADKTFYDPEKLRPRG